MHELLSRSARREWKSTSCSWYWYPAVVTLIAVVSIGVNVYLLSTPCARCLCDVEKNSHLDHHTAVSRPLPRSGAQSFGYNASQSFRNYPVEAPTDNNDIFGRRTSSSSSSSSSSNSSSTASGAGHGSSGGHGHQHDALVFLFGSILIGTAVIHISYYAPWMQVTVMLFIIGMAVSLILEGTDIAQYLGVFGESYKMWLEIDPHLLLFTMLPTLLAGDAMTIDTQVAKQVSLQCIYLAGPGVLLNSMSVAVFLCLYLDWPFLLSLTTGSILCATDPVAVVALLKELGANPVLTIQIQGESLLNDGTAIVLYSVAYKMLSGEDWTAVDIMTFLIKTGCLAFALGVFSGYLFFFWIRAAGNRFNHHCDIIQILLTLSAAYASFVLAEGVLKMSGVLSTVASSLVLAHYMWPHIVSEHSMHNFWHTAENLGNILIFILGGALCGAAMVHIKPVNYIHLLVIYLFLILVRGLVIFCSRPLLRILSLDKKPVSWEDASVMTWGGLRGAVGLALAIQVKRGRAESADGDYKIGEEHADLVLFFVSGIAFLTTAINATTAPALVHMLGITQTPDVYLKLMKKFNEQLVSLSSREHHPPEVTKSLSDMLHHIEKHFHDDAKKSTHISSMAYTHHMKDTHSNQTTIKEYEASVQAYAECTQVEKDRLQSFLQPCIRLEDTLLNRVDEMNQTEVDKVLKFLRGHPHFDPELSMVINHVFLSIVQVEYNKYAASGELRPGSNEAVLLQTSIQIGQSDGAHEGDLLDYKHLAAHAGDGEAMEQIWRELSQQTSCLAKIVGSNRFGYVLCGVIVMNVVCVMIEEAAGNTGDTYWLIIEIVFQVIFTLEFFIKLIVLKHKYFYDFWNLFDLVLVLLGLVGVVLSLLAENDQVQNDIRFFRLAKVMRSLRLVRVFRLFHQRLIRDMDVSDELDIQMSRMLIFTCYSRAHLESQARFLEYFSGNGALDEEDEVEVARCLLQSQTGVYNAWREVVDTMRKIEQMNPELLEEVKWVKEQKQITELLEHYVSKANKEGALTSKQAEAILHPLHKQIKNCLDSLHQKIDGKVPTRDLESTPQPVLGVPVPAHFDQKPHTKVTAAPAPVKSTTGNARLLDAHSRPVPVTVPLLEANASDERAERECSYSTNEANYSTIEDGFGLDDDRPSKKRTQTVVKKRVANLLTPAKEDSERASESSSSRRTTPISEYLATADPSATPINTVIKKKWRKQKGAKAENNNSSIGRSSVESCEEHSTP